MHWRKYAYIKDIKKVCLNETSPVLYTEKAPVIAAAIYIFLTLCKAVHFTLIQQFSPTILFIYCSQIFNIFRFLYFNRLLTSHKNSRIGSFACIWVFQIESCLRRRLKFTQVKCLQRDWFVIPKPNRQAEHPWSHVFRPVRDETITLYIKFLISCCI